MNSMRRLFPALCFVLAVLAGPEIRASKETPKEEWFAALSDLVVVGTLEGAEEKADRDWITGEGRIVVHEVLRGDVKGKPGLVARWQVSPMHGRGIAASAGKKGIWMVKLGEKPGEVWIDDPGRFFGLDQREAIERALRKQVGRQIDPKGE